MGPVASEFQLQDLLWASEIVEQVGAFPDEVVNELARIIHRKRIAGAPRDDPELRLALERAIQNARDALIKGRDTALQDAESLTEHAKDTWAKQERLRKALVKSTTKVLVRRARWGLFRRSLGALAAAAAVGLGVYTLVLWALPDLDSRAELLSVGLGIVGVLVPFSVAVLKWVWPRYRKERDAAPGEAERQARSVEG